MKITVVIKRIDKDDYGKKLPVPLYPAGQDDMNKVAEGELRKMEIKNPRNLDHHNVFMAQLRMVVNNSNGRWRSVDHILIAVKKSLGLYDIGRDFDGKDIIVDRSIAFENMDEDEYSENVHEPAIPLLVADSGIPEHILRNPKTWEEYLK
jgi:hypothetical protein